MSGYTIDFDETKYTNFFTKNDELLEKYNEIWDKVNNTIKKGFDSEPAYDEKYFRTKTMSYEVKINTTFHGDKTPKDGSYCVCLPVILTNSACKTGKNCYS